MQMKPTQLLKTGPIPSCCLVRFKSTMKLVIYVLLDRDGNRRAIYYKCKLIYLCILDLHVLTHVAYEIDV